MSGLTQRQNDGLSLIKSKVAESGVAPSFREIAAGLGLRSISGVHRILSALEERGAIRRLPNRARAIEVLSDQSLRELLGNELADELENYAAQQLIKPKTALREAVRAYLGLDQ